MVTQGTRFLACSWKRSINARNPSMLASRGYAFSRITLLPSCNMLTSWVMIACFLSPHECVSKQNCVRHFWARGKGALWGARRPINTSLRMRVILNLVHCICLILQIKCMVLVIPVCILIKRNCKRPPWVLRLFLRVVTL